MALARDGVVLSEAVEQTGGRATDALGLIERVLADAGLKREVIEVIAVGLGPGSYTGIRSAIAVAQGWQLARGVKLLGVSSVEAIAAQAQAENVFGRVNVVVDAQRGEFYLTTYELSASGRQVAEPLRIATQAEVETRKAGGEICVGPEAGRGFFPSAAMAASLSAGSVDFTSREKLEPIYLRETAFVKTMPPRC